MSQKVITLLTTIGAIKDGPDDDTKVEKGSLIIITKLTSRDCRRLAKTILRGDLEILGSFLISITETGYTSEQHHVYSYDPHMELRHERRAGPIDYHIQTFRSTSDTMIPEGYEQDDI